MRLCLAGRPVNTSIVLPTSLGPRSLIRSQPRVASRNPQACQLDWASNGEDGSPHRVTGLSLLMRLNGTSLDLVGMVYSP